MSAGGGVKINRDCPRARYPGLYNAVINDIMPPENWTAEARS